MNIEWEKRERYEGRDTSTWFAKIELPSNIRRNREAPWLIAAAYTLSDNGMYHTSFLPAVNMYFAPPTQRLHTEKGARRRIRKYLELWAIAGYPTGE